MFIIKIEEKNEKHINFDFFLVFSKLNAFEIKVRKNI